jgi:cell division protease FtsH
VQNSRSGSRADQPVNVAGSSAGKDFNAFSTRRIATEAAYLLAVSFVKGIRSGGFRVTIVSRGQALGVTYQRPDSDRYNYPEAYLRARIVGMLGGRAAEETVYGTKTTGAESDIEQATHLARQMVTRWGMSERLGMVQLAPRENPYLNVPGGYAGARPFSEETAEAIDAEVLKIIGDSHEEAKRLLNAHRKQLDALAEALLARETLNEQEIHEVTGFPRAPALETGVLGVQAGK